MPFLRASGSFLLYVCRKFGGGCARLFSWTRKTLDHLCDRPDHLQRLSIIGAGISLWPVIIGMIVLLTWFATIAPIGDQAIALAVIGIFGNTLFGLLGLFALVVVTMLGTIKGLRLTGPGGSGVTFETTAGDGKGLSMGAAGGGIPGYDPYGIPGFPMPGLAAPAQPTGQITA